MAGSAIWSHKLRSFLTLLGIIFGVAVVILVVTIVEGFNRYVDEKVADLKERYRQGKVGDVEVKKKLSAALNNFLDPIRERRAALERNPRIKRGEAGACRAQRWRRASAICRPTNPRTTR